LQSKIQNPESKIFRRKLIMPDKKLMLSIVCPAYEEEGSLPHFHPRLTAVLADLEADHAIEILYVDDGSRDGTLALLRQFAAADPRVRYLSLSRNFGHQAALTAGLEHARGDAVISLDCDLQHPPELIVPMVEQWRKGFDIVLAERHDEEIAGWFKRFTSQQFYRLLRWMSDTEVHPACADFRLMSRPAVDALMRLRETHRFLRGMVSWLGFSLVSVPYQVGARAAGQSHYTLKRMLRLAGDGLLSFSRLPLHLPFYTGLGCIALSALTVLLFAVSWLCGVGVSWLSGLLLVVGLLLGGLILCGLGIVGEYVGRIYEQVKQRPIYLLKEVSRLIDVARPADQVAAEAPSAGAPRGERDFPGPHRASAA
jgi:glycosyltransferase involved in cell wall biosynthesis